MLRRVPANMLSSRRKPFGQPGTSSNTTQGPFSARRIASAASPISSCQLAPAHGAHLAQALGLRQPFAQVVIGDVGRDVASIGHFPVSRYPLYYSELTAAELSFYVQEFARIHRRGREARRAASCRGRRPASRARRHHRGRGRIAGMPGAAVRPDQGLSGGFSRVHQCHHQSAARGACARHRSGAAAARRAQGLDGEAADAEDTTRRWR